MSKKVKIGRTDRLASAVANFILRKQLGLSLILKKRTVGWSRRLKIVALSSFCSLAATMVAISVATNKVALKPPPGLRPASVANDIPMRDSSKLPAALQGRISSMLRWLDTCKHCPKGFKDSALQLKKLYDF